MLYFDHYKVLNESIKSLKKLIVEKQFADKTIYEDEGVEIVEKIFCDEYEEKKDIDYFFGCSYSVYELTYNDRCIEYCKIFADTNEIDFIKAELNEGIYSMFFDRFVQNPFISQQIFYSLKKRFEFLQDKLQNFGYNLNLIEDNYELIRNNKVHLLFQDSFKEIWKEEYTLEPIKNFTEKEESISINETPTLQPLKWQGTPTELIELTKALIENKTFKGQGSQKEIFIKIQNLFDIELKTIDKTINSFDEVRSGGNEAKFLDALKVSLLSNINIKRKKRENR